jgi:hypothetical protein
MFVSGFFFQALSGCLCKVEEARKKRTFFPEDVIDSHSLFHLSLLSEFGILQLTDAGASFITL